MSFTSKVITTTKAFEASARSLAGQRTACTTSRHDNSCCRREKLEIHKQPERQQSQKLFLTNHSVKVSKSKMRSCKSCQTQLSRFFSKTRQDRNQGQPACQTFPIEMRQVGCPWFMLCYGWTLCLSSSRTFGSVLVGKMRGRVGQVCSRHGTSVEFIS